MAIPPTVTTGTTITTSWGNAVRDWAASNELNGSVAVSYATTSTMADAASVSLTVPAGWLAWEATVQAFWKQNSSTATTYDFQVRIDGTDQNLVDGVFTLSSAQITVDSVIGRRTGMTTTGSRAFALRAKHNSSTSVAMLDGLLVVRAVRTS